MELTIIETSAYLEMRKQFSLLAVQLEGCPTRTG